MLASEWWWLSQTEVMEMTKRGVPGVYTYNYWDGWAPNFMLWIARHAQLDRPVLRDAELRRRRRRRAAAARRRPRARGAPRPATQAAAGGRAVAGGQSQEWYRPYPVPPEGVQWSGRSNINMQQSALLIALNAVAKNREMILENYYIKNKMMIEKGKTRAPHAYVVPAEAARAGPMRPT